MAFVENKNDFTRDWVASSRFMFYVKLFCILSFFVGGAYGLYTHRYKAPKVTINESSLFEPKYK
jgi:hypothetical protein